MIHPNAVSDFSVRVFDDRNDSDATFNWKSFYLATRENGPKRKSWIESNGPGNEISAVAGSGDSSNHQIGFETEGCCEIVDSIEKIHVGIYETTSTISCIDMTIGVHQP
jgi:hypothetical protein